jgi:hypothetical protein
MIFCPKVIHYFNIVQENQQLFSHSLRNNVRREKKNPFAAFRRTGEGVRIMQERPLA